MGTLLKNVLVASVAATFMLLTACSGSDSTPPPQPSTLAHSTHRTVTTVVPATPDNVDLMKRYSIVVGASTLVCGDGKSLPHFDLPLNGKITGFTGEFISVETNKDLTRIEWDAMKASSIIVNGKLWAPIQTMFSPLTTELYAKDWSGEITSIEACNRPMP